MVSGQRPWRSDGVICWDEVCAWSQCEAEVRGMCVTAIHKWGPGPAKPPPVTLGVSGQGFSEKVPLSAKVVKNGIKTIGILTIDKDFGEFIEVDKAYWNKEVAPFVGEWVCCFIFFVMSFLMSLCLVYWGLWPLQALGHTMSQILD